MERGAEMIVTKSCPKCGATLPPNAPGGICPTCLMQAGMESVESAGPNTTGQKTVLGTGFVPPDPGELNKHFLQLEILELLGKGGMGAVYKARQPSLDRLVAIKILPRDLGADPAFADRFAREARALARLHHSNIIAIYDFGRADDLFYILMEFVDGLNIRQLMKRGELKPEDALAVVPQICDALQYAHDEGIVHRDIKPENVLISKQGRVKLADFGLAKLIDTAADHTLTGTGQVMGTWHYMAPEQMLGSGSVDHRADIYALGVVFYELLTGQLPVGRFAPPSKQVQVDVRLDEVVLRTLEAEPDRRYQRAGEIKTDIDAISSTLGQRRPDARQSTPPRQRLRTWRHPWMTSPKTMLVAGLGLVPMLILTAVWWFGGQRSTSEITAPQTIRSVAEINPSPPTDDVVENSIGMKLVRIPAGEFQMGSPVSEAGRWPNEATPHKVSVIEPFHLGMYEVTQAEYEQVVGINPSPHVGASLPVGHVRWDEAREFCRKLSELPAERAANRAYRLPHEREWEYACRAGTTSAYHYGDSLSLEQANFNGYDGWGAEAVKLAGSAPGRPVAVGSYSPNAWGLYDMHGNVPEVCEELWEEQNNRVIRGGGWNKDAGRCRSAYRAGDFRIAYTPRIDLVGLRVVMVPHTGALPDVDRMVAEWATQPGVRGTATLVFAGSQQVVRPGETLPTKAFSILALTLDEGDRAGDSVLGRLSRLPEIRQLSLNGQPISDVGLLHLESLKSLRTLTLQNTQVTAAGVEALRRKLPSCQISF